MIKEKNMRKYSQILIVYRNQCFSIKNCKKPSVEENIQPNFDKCWNFYLYDYFLSPKMCIQNADIDVKLTDATRVAPHGVAYRILLGMYGNIFSM